VDHPPFQLGHVIGVEFDHPMILGVLEHPGIDQFGQFLTGQAIPAGVWRFDPFPRRPQQVIGLGHDRTPP
jgi:hypothetical protein